MGFQTDFMTGLAELLDTLGIGTYLPSGKYTTADTAITMDQAPIGSEGQLAGPDRAITISLYPVSDDGTTDSVQGIQFRVRGPRNDRRFVKDTSDALFDQLHDLQRVTIGGTPVVRIWRNSGSNLPNDSSNRQESTQNYYAQITRSGTHRKD